MFSFNFPSSNHTVGIIEINTLVLHNIILKHCVKKFFVVLKRFYLFIFRERGREGERDGEKHQCVVHSRAPPTGDLACNPGMCPDWESNQ